ncbi:MAG: hypothetical protein MI974_28175 [Chitinophagales bacterium]|nr:hypothetical protein [Chitinophagales bacterium]
MKETQFVTSKPPLLYAVFLYSEKDNNYREELQSYLSLLEKERIFTKIDYWPVDDLNVRRLKKRLPDIDICFCLMSTYFLAAMSKDVAFERYLMGKHQLKHLRVISFLLREWKMEETVFRSSYILPEKDKPLLANVWESGHQAMLYAYNKLPAICQDVRERKDEVEAAWSFLQDHKREANYWRFLRKYRFCRYAKQARQELDELVESRLWKNAIRRQTAAAYYQYLREAPLRKHYLEAASLLHAIEESEEMVSKDMVRNDLPSYYLRYKSLFPKGKYQEFAHDKVKGFLKEEPLLEEEPQEMVNDDQAFYLLKKAYSALKDDPEGLFSLESYIKYCWAIRVKMTGLVRRLQNMPFNFISMLMLIIFFEMMLLVFFSMREGLIDVLTANLRITFFMVIVHMFAFIFVRRAYHNIIVDRQFANDAQTLLKRASVLIKASFITNDQRSINQILKVVLMIEEKEKEVSKKGFLDYMIQNRVLESAEEISPQL